METGLTFDEDAGEPLQVGGHDVERVLGRGGMGKVYACKDDKLDRTVAVKVLLPELRTQKEMAARFVREARAMAKVSSPHVVTVFAVGDDGGVPFLVMELLDGEDLSAKVKREGALPIDVALSYALDSTRGLMAAAAAGLVHRDVKPANLFVVDGRVKLTDFGLARPVDGSADLTQAGLVVGTPHYLAPELARGQPASIASDVYALGATLYEMLAGRPPFDGESALDVLTAHLMQPVPPLAQKRADVPAGVAALVDEMLAKKVDQRLADYTVLESRLAALLEAARHHQASSATRVGKVVPAPPAPATATPGAASALFAPPTVSLPNPVSHTGIGRTQPTSPMAFDKRKAAQIFAGGAVALAVVSLLAVALSGDDRMKRIEKGQAKEVLAELDKISDAERQPEDTRIEGHALWALDEKREAFAAWSEAAKGGAVDPRAASRAVDALAAEKAGAAVAMLAAWPDASIEGKVRGLLDEASFTTRHNALDVLEDRKAVDDAARAAVGMKDVLTGDGCQQRRAGMQLLKKHGKGKEALDAVRALGRQMPDNLCLVLELTSAEQAIKQRSK